MKAFVKVERVLHEGRLLVSGGEGSPSFTVVYSTGELIGVEAGDWVEIDFFRRTAHAYAPEEYIDG